MTLLKNILRWLTALTIITISATACNIEEDESDCVAEMKLTFSFTKNGQDHFGVDVPSLSVFAFDENKKYVGRWEENDNTKFGADYTMKLPLSPGTYSFVVWGGLKDTNYYLCKSGQTEAIEPVVGQSTISDVILRLSCDSRDLYGQTMQCVDYVPGALYFGSTDEVTLVNNKENKVTIELRKNTKRINLSIIGLPDASTRANIYPHIDIWMESANGGYDFWNGFEASSNRYTYIQRDIESAATDTQSSSIHTLGLKYGNDYDFTIYNKSTGRKFYTADLLEDFIKKVPAYSSQDAVDEEDQFDITIDVRSALGVSVTVNGWNVGISGSIIQ